MSTSSFDFGRSYSDEYILNFYPDTPVRSLISVDLASHINPEMSFPLRLRPSKIYDIFEKIIGSASLTQLPTHKPIALAVKLLLASGALIGRIPFIPLSTEALKNEDAISKLYAVANFVSYSSFFIWATLKMVNRTIISLDVVKRSEDRRCECIQRAALLSFNFLNAAIAQTPLMYLAYKYNPDKPWIVALSVCDLFFPAYSMQMLYRNMLEACRHSAVEKKLSEIKRDLTKAISFHQNEVREHKTDLFQVNTAIGSLEAESFAHFINHICSMRYVAYNKTQALHDQTCLKIYSLAIPRLLGTLLTATVLTWMGYIVYNMTHEFTSNDAFIALAIGYIVLWNAALLRDVLIETSIGFFKTCQELAKCTVPPNLTADYLWPQVSFGFKMACIALSMFGAIPAFKASYDILPNNLKIASSILLSLSLAFLSYKPMRELSHDFVCYLIQNFGTHEEKKQTHYQKQLDLLKEYILAADISEMARLTLHLDPDLNTNPLITKHNFQRDELFMYCRPS